MCTIRFCLLFAVIHLAIPTSAQLRKALVVGNAKYGGKNTLNNAINDALKINDGLIRCQFETVCKTDQDKDHLQKIIDSVYQPGPPNEYVAVFYYAGHSVQVAGRQYILPVGEKIRNETEIKDRALPLDNIVNAMKRSGSKINIVLVDACRNNPFAEFAGDQEAGRLTFSSNPGDLFIGFSTSPGQVAADGAKENSFFSEALAKYMNEPGLELAELFRKIIEDVTQKESAQIPYYVSTLSQPFSFSVNDPVGDIRNQVPGKVAFRFNSTASCDLFLDGMNIGRGVGFMQWLSYGKHTIRAVSIEFKHIVYRDTIVLNKSDETFEQTIVLPIADLIIAEYKNRLDSVLGSNKIFYGSSELSLKLAELKCNMIFLRGDDNYKMGSNSGNHDEQPVHSVKLNDFYMSKVEVTQQLWKTVMGSVPELQSLDCPDCPVTNVSWDDANEFITRLNETSGEQYRLPTEAEWEFAARGGIFSDRNPYAEESMIDKYGWYVGNARGRPHAVGGLAANKKGLFDMCGNVAEWCSDWYETFYYRNSAVLNPTGPGSGSQKVVRGGSWDDDARFCRTFQRNKFPVKTRTRTIGFRLARSA